MRALVLLCLLGMACDAGAPRCRFGVEHAVFRSSAGSFDDVAVIEQPGGSVALFSEASGLYGRRLDRDGTPLADAVRLAGRCQGGIAAAASGELQLLACLRPGAEEPGEVSVYALDAQLGVERLASSGPVGRGSHGVALALHGDISDVSAAALRRGAVVLAWQDAAVDGARLWILRDLESAPARVSEPGWHAAAPSLALRGTRLFAGWSEVRELGKREEGRVRLLDLAAAHASIASVVTSQDGAPSPDLAGSGEDLWLAFRDRRSAGRKTGLYLVRLDPEGKPLDKPVRAARADGVGRPVLRSCLGGLLAATPRTFAGDYFVGVVRADATLRALSGEQQFYEDSHEFAQVASACLGERALLLIAERGKLGALPRTALAPPQSAGAETLGALLRAPGSDTGRAALRSVSFACD